MSFLNPVNEPVLRFSSTDAGAPQINYNARAVGDIKAVLKACLVTGYGATASAGWTAVNEVGHVAEFVSPSAAMSDYRLGIDDTSTSNTTWYYQYQDTRVNPSYNSPSKNFSTINETHTDNGWQLFVTNRGLFFIELGYNTGAAKLAARITYWGAVKSGLSSASSANIGFFNIGENALISEPDRFYDPAYPHYRLASYTSARMLDSTAFDENVVYQTGVSNIDMASEIYLSSSAGDVVIGMQPGVLIKVVNDNAAMYGIADETVTSRPVFKCCAGNSSTSNTYLYTRGRVFLIYLDYWEY